MGSRIYTHPNSYTFHEFLIDRLEDAFGANWLKAEFAKPAGSRHIVARWLEAWSQLRAQEGVTLQGHPGKFAQPTGETQELISLAYDLYKLQAVRELPSRLMGRLRDRNGFQGARYEVAIAATFIRKGFRISWTKETSIRAPEFTAIHPETGEVLAVEAKSRHRPGAVHESGATTPPAPAELDRLLQEAVSQAPGDKPFAIFIDANLPPNAEDSAPDQRLLEGLALGSSITLPPEVTLLALTNFGWHYEGVRVVRQRATFVLHRSPKAAFPIRHEPSFSALLESLDSYGRVPLDERDRDNDS